MTQAQRTRQAIYISLLMVIIASTAAVATKFASARASTEAIVTVQYAVCLLLCLRITLRPGLANLRSQRMGLHLFRGAAGVLGFYLFYAALEHIPMVDAVLLRQSAPLSVPLVVWLWNRESIAASAWLPLVIGFAGVAVILRPSPAGLSWWHAGGFISALCLAVSMVATHRLARTEPASRILFYYFLLSLLCVAPFSVADFRGLRWQEWAAMLYIGITIYLTLRLYTRAYAMAPAHAIAPVNYLAVVLAAGWGWLLWGQVPDFWSVLGSALVIAGGLLTIALARTPAPGNASPGPAASGQGSQKA
ncbi:DMT family transporter [Pseudohalioglobus sediminis]|uniref:DMT family transporter n=1 Tax=Pseudohalioglobus sediminis TaxID=2606449 RepID=A0A5B0X7F6_9GAMM|nr:DMT family transporter [Pseudohalioglobus sediminis]KAA1194281.1 DMT family transporter [Pseudohalioglobus sediminis]